MKETRTIIFQDIGGGMLRAFFRDPSPFGEPGAVAMPEDGLNPVPGKQYFCTLNPSKCFFLEYAGKRYRVWFAVLRPP